MVCYVILAVVRFEDSSNEKNFRFTQKKETWHTASAVCQKL